MAQKPRGRKPKVQKDLFDEPYTDTDLAIAIIKESSAMTDKQIQTVFNIPGFAIAEAVRKSRDSGAIVRYNNDKAEMLDLAQMKIMDAFSSKELRFETSKDLAAMFKSFDSSAKTSKETAMNSMAVLHNIIAQVTNSRLRGGVLVEAEIVEEAPSSIVSDKEEDSWKNVHIDL